MIIPDFETHSSELMLRIEQVHGYRGMNFPRWQSIRYGAQCALDIWRYLAPSRRYRRMPETARAVILYQPFSGVRPEWVERNFRLGGS